MRKQSRLTALFAAVLMSVTLLAADAFATAAPASAATTRGQAAITRTHRRYVRYRTTRYRYSRYRRRTSRAGFRAAPVPVTGDVWAKLRWCESGGNYAINTGNGYYGAYQFAAGTWRGLGYPGLPHQASPQVQDEAAQRLQARGGWRQWPACSRRLGLR